MQMNQDVIGSCLGLVSVLGRGSRTARSEWFFGEVYWSESMNMLIVMAPKMWPHTVTGTGGVVHWIGWTMSRLIIEVAHQCAGCHN